ncbi:MAG: ATP-binding protein [Pseudomonadota bacterium]
MADYISLTMASGDDPDRLTNAIGAFVEANAIAGRSAYALELVLEELVTNVVRHGTGPNGATIAVDLMCDNGTLTGTVSDTAAPFDPLRQKPADTTLSLEERDVGGLGIHLVREMTDSLSYSREDGKNRLTFTIAFEKDAP